MKPVNCLRCDFRHKDNGNCTAVGGFCTAVPAAHCPLLREYLDTGLGPAEVSELVKDWSDLCTIVGECGGIDRMRELAEADKDGRLVVLPCKVGQRVFALLDTDKHISECEHAERYERTDGTAGYYCGHQQNTFVYGERWDRVFKPVKEADDFCSSGERKEGAEC